MKRSRGIRAMRVDTRCTSHEPGGYRRRRSVAPWWPTGRHLARIGAKCTRWIREGIGKRRTIAELSRLEDHMLADIGIDRAQIPMIAQEMIAPSGEVPRRTFAATVRPTEYRGEAANDPKHGSVAA